MTKNFLENGWWIRDALFWARIHQPFLRTLLVLFSGFFSKICKFKWNTTVRFSQSECVLHSNLQNPGENDKEFSWEWSVNTDKGLWVIWFYISTKNFIICQFVDGKTDFGQSKGWSRGKEFVQLKKTRHYKGFIPLPHRHIFWRILSKKPLGNIVSKVYNAGNQRLSFTTKFSTIW